VANFIECNREQQYLLPPALQDWLPPKDLAWLIIDAVDAMDLSAFYNEVSGGRAGTGCPGMGIDLRNTQSSEVMAKWKGDFASGGLVEVSGWG